uniref:Uncharacterized protein n=1 Tax=Rhizophora mucronata TaxID=61149 RepID=A0A2P2L809_RHIMU
MASSCMDRVVVCRCSIIKIHMQMHGGDSKSVGKKQQCIKKPMSMQYSNDVELKNHTFIHRNALLYGRPPGLEI